MNRVLVFFLGFVAGVVTSILGLVIFGIVIMGTSGSHYDDDYDAYDESIFAADTVWVEEAVAGAEVVESDSIEVRGRNGYVNLAVGMSKGDVKAKLGRPKTTEYSYGTETWRYEFPGDGMYGTARIMTIQFDGGGLKSINQF